MASLQKNRVFKQRLYDLVSKLSNENKQRLKNFELVDMAIERLLSLYFKLIIYLHTFKSR